jgi:hypothetical protein
MAIRPQAEIDEETNQSAFDEALNERAEEESVEESGRGLSLPEIEDTDFEIVEGEPEPEPTIELDTESNTLGRLVDLLENRQAPVPVVEAPKRAVAVPVDREALRKKFNEQLHETDDPFALVEESANALIGGQTAALSLEVQKLKKEVLKNDPINKMVLDKWGTEVETVIAGLQASQQNHPDAYSYAIRQVRDTHFDEILESQVTERVSAKTRPGKTATLGATPTTTKRKTKKVYASQRDKNEAKRYGLSLENYLVSQGKI